MKVPTKYPEPGFYYHYKHDPKGSINIYAYEVIGVGCHTEDSCSPEDANMVIYRPLYESAEAYRSGRFYYLRPLANWREGVILHGKGARRFKKIEDPKIIKKLEKIRDKMYGK